MCSWRTVKKPVFKGWKLLVFTCNLLGIKKIVVRNKMTKKTFVLIRHLLHKNTTTFWTCNPFHKYFFFFYILSYQSDSLRSTKNRLSDTNSFEDRPKWLKKTNVFAIKVQKLTDSLAYIKYIKEEIILNTLFTNKLI